MSGGKISARVAAHWPHFMNAGPASSSVFLVTMTTMMIYNCVRHVAVHLNAQPASSSVFLLKLR